VAARREPSPRWSAVRQQLAALVTTRDAEATLPDLIRSIGPTVEERPSLLGAIGVSAVELLANVSEAAAVVGKATVVRTVVFTDLENFTTFTRREGDRAATALLGEHYRSADDIVREHGGRVVKRLGDGLLLSFTDPAHAVASALDLIDHSPRPLRLRAGMHMGELVRDRADLVGHVVNVAARVTEAASGSQALVTQDVRDVVLDELAGAVSFSRPRLRKLKGIGDRVAVCRATRA
jgi:adenylate cyclase